VIRSVALAAPATVSSNGAATSYNVSFGYTGVFAAQARGLVPATTTTGTVTQDPDQTFDPASTDGTLSYTVEVPAGTTHARFSLFNADVAPDADIDLYVFRGATAVGTSGNSGSDEEVNLVNPTAGTYTVYIHGWGLPADTSPFKLYTWVLAGNMTATAPGSAVLGASGAINLSFNGLTPGVKYLGSVAYSGISGLPNPTIVRVDP
jgi:Bacterial pre-peptidase C-terminal domain